jgi:hypothetical protein
MNVFNCAECGKRLDSLEIKYGWKTVRGSRVHTLCISRWMDRTSDERAAKTKAVK